VKHFVRGHFIAQLMWVLVICTVVVVMFSSVSRVEFLLLSGVSGMVSMSAAIVMRVSSFFCFLSAG
jgi:hypothetical protein